MFTNEQYDILKKIAQYILPALGTLYFTLSGIWGLPYGEQIVGTLTAIDTFLGILLGISKKNYAGDGIMIVDTSNPEKDVYRMELEDDVENLSQKEYVTFRVQHGD